MNAPSLPNLVFRNAHDDEVPEVVKIHNANVRHSEEPNPNGFLLAPVTATEIQAKRDRATQYFVATLAETVIGFVALSRPVLTAEGLMGIHWSDPAWPERILRDQPFYIQVIAIRPDYAGRGVARFLYASLFEQYPNKLFSAFVVVKPVSNDRSLRFHQKQGFHEAGRVQRDQFLNMQNYESIFLIRNPS